MMMMMTEKLVFQLIGSWLSNVNLFCAWKPIAMLMPMTSCYIFADYTDAQHFFSCADNADSDKWSWVFRRIWHIIKFIWKVGLAICNFYLCWWVILRIWQNLGTSSDLSGKLDLQFAKTCWTTISVTATISDLQTSSLSP